MVEVMCYVALIVDTIMVATQHHRRRSRSLRCMEDIIVAEEGLDMKPPSERLHLQVLCRAYFPVC